MSWAAVGASVLPGVGAYLGAREQAKAVKQTNAQNAAIANANLQQQDFFARNGIQVKALDARKAGISPLAAMGAQTFSPNPTPLFNETPVSPLGAGLSQMGQDVGRAMSAVSTEQDRTKAAMELTAMNNLQLENQALQNDMLRLQIQKIANPGNPALPGLGPVSNSNMPLLTGQANSTRAASGAGYVQENPLSRVHASPGNPAQEVGTVTDYGFAQTPTGLAIVPSKDIKEKIEDQFVPETMWAIRNQLLPNLSHFGITSGGPKAPDPKYYPPPKGSTKWVWNPLYQEFQGNNQTGANRNKR